MTHLVQMAAVWTGFVGSPGYSNFYAEADGNAPATAQTLSDAIHDFFASLSGNIPGEARVNVPVTWREFDDSNGQTVAEGSVGTAAAEVVGSSGAQFAANSGVLVEWLTGTFINGHRLRGRTYLVPLCGAFDTNGTLSSGVGAAIAGYAQDYLDADVISVVWHRPVNGSGGSSAVIVDPRVSDTPCVLRSRGK